MKAYIETFKFSFKQITRDSMLVLMIIAPFLCGIAFKFIIPVFQEFIYRNFGISGVIAPYYRILDGLLAFLAPCLICIVSSFIILEEFDDKVSPYLFVTPIGYNGYIFSRLILPATGAFLLSFIVLMIFNLSDISMLRGALLAIIGTLYAIATTLVVVSLADNKVEGLAITKLTGISFLGILAPTFIKGNAQYLFSLLPSFWLGKAAIIYDIKGYSFIVIAGIITSLIWIIIFYRKFKWRLG